MNNIKIMKGNVEFGKRSHIFTEKQSDFLFVDVQSLSVCDQKILRVQSDEKHSISLRQEFKKLRYPVGNWNTKEQLNNNTNSTDRDFKISSNSNADNLAPFENPEESLSKILLYLENSEWENLIKGLRGIARMTKHHSEYLTGMKMRLVIAAVSKHVRNLRSQVSRTACFTSECIFRYIPRLSDADKEELSKALFSRTGDTNKFLRRDSNEALNAMIDSGKFSKGIIFIFKKVSDHPNATVRAAASRLFSRLIKSYGCSTILILPKDIRDMIFRISSKFLTDSNLDARTYAKEIFFIFSKNKSLLPALSEAVSYETMASINKALARV